MNEIKNENPFCTVVTGDYNSHNNSWFHGDKSDNYGLTMQNIFDDHSLSQLVKQPRYIANKSNTCIDLVCTDQPNLILNNEIHPSLHSTCHHQVNYIRMNLKCPPPPPYKRFVWHYDRANEKNLCDAVTGYNWQLLNSFDSPMIKLKNKYSTTVIPPG